MRHLLAIFLVILVTSALWLASPTQATKEDYNAYGYGYQVSKPLSGSPVPSPHGGSWPVERLNGYLVLEVLDTGSMEPLLNGQSRIVVADQPVGIGDIVLYLKEVDGKLENPVHRIIGETPDGLWIIKGDAVDNWWDYVPKDKVLLRVIGILY